MNLRKNNAPAEGVVVDEAAESANRKRLFVAGGVAAALVAVGGLSYALIGGGGDDVPTGAVAVTHTPATSQPTDAPSTATSAPTIAKFTGSNARDPFKPLVVEQAASTGAASAASTAGSTSGSTAAATTAPAAGGSASVPTSSSTPSPTASSTASSTKSSSPVAPVATSLKVTMVSVASGDTSARIKVNSKTYSVKPLEEFGSYFKLLSLRDSTCGTVQYGDSIFDLCEGKTRTFN